MNSCYTSKAGQKDKEFEPFIILKKNDTNLEEHLGTDSCLYLLVVWHLYTDTRQLLVTSFEVAENCKEVLFLSELHNIMSSL